MILRGDARHIPLRDESVQCVVTSPPYWGLRDYGTAKWEGGEADCAHDQRRLAGENDKQRTSEGTGRDKMTGGDCRWCAARRIDAQIGLEPTPDEYVATMVGVFRELWRVLRKDGTVWLNLGDSFAGSWGNYGGQNRGSGTQRARVKGSQAPNPAYDGLEGWRPPTASVSGLKAKDLCMIPARVALALQADGWWIRSDIIWAKPNPMPESVTDRPTRSHEYLFLLSKSATYYYDADAIREPSVTGDIRRPYTSNGAWDMDGRPLEQRKGGQPRDTDANARNKRDVWTINSEPTPEAHFATFPQALVTPCILAGSRKGDLVFDPFFGSGTVGQVAEQLGRRWVGLELSEPYIDIAKERTAQMGLFA